MPLPRLPGSILVARMMVRGVAGVVTDGGLRDSHEIARTGNPELLPGPLCPHQPDQAPRG